jgi:hypothetical protein
MNIGATGSNSSSSIKGSGGKRAKSKRDRDAPKRARSAYIFFSTEKRSEVKEEHPSMHRITSIITIYQSYYYNLLQSHNVITDMDFGGIARILAEQWRNMSVAEKEVSTPIAASILAVAN